MGRRKLRGGILGGGIGSMIGPVHIKAGTLDGEAEFVAGVLSAEPRKSKKSGEKFHFDPSRIYKDYREMAEKEAALPASKRIDFVAITTPNVYHFNMAKSFLKAGFHVVCEKPMTCNLDEAKQLKRIVDHTGKVFVLLHTYTGYPMVKQARYMARNGLLGNIHKVVVEYSQGWLAKYLEGKNIKTRAKVWRLEPEMSGLSCTMADVGIHAENLVRYITGLEIEKLCADISSFIPGGILDDDGSVLIRYKSGARGVLTASQVSTGEGNNLNIRIYGSKLGLGWSHENPECLIAKSPDGKTITYSSGSPLLCDAAKNTTRLPIGHSEGVIEAFANIYSEAFRAMRDLMKEKTHGTYDFPTVEDGVTGMSFIETVIASSDSSDKWTMMKK
jgi:predicted dehydrogenase